MYKKSEKGCESLQSFCPCFPWQMSSEDARLDTRPGPWLCWPITSLLMGCWPMRGRGWVTPTLGRDHNRLIVQSLVTSGQSFTLNRHQDWSNASDYSQLHQIINEKDELFQSISLQEAYILKFWSSMQGQRGRGKRRRFHVYADVRMKKKQL